MRLLRFLAQNRPVVGIQHGEWVQALPSYSMADLMALSVRERNALADVGQAQHRLADLTLLAPVDSGRNIVGVGMNYAAHARESLLAKGLPVKMPSHPVFFTKASTTLNDPFGVVPLDATVTQQLDWEVELAVVIGKNGKNIPAGAALDHVFGYMVLNDITARDLQTRHQQFFKGKSLDGCAPCGPVLVTADELPDPHHLALRCWVNGVLKQDSDTSDLIFNIPTLIAALSAGQTLLAGDIIATGTPSGVGFARTPAEFLQVGDVVCCEVASIGYIENTIVQAS